MAMTTPQLLGIQTCRGEPTGGFRTRVSSKKPEGPKGPGCDGRVSNASTTFGLGSLGVVSGHPLTSMGLLSDFPR